MNETFREKKENTVSVHTVPVVSVSSGSIKIQAIANKNEQIPLKN